MKKLIAVIAIVAITFVFTANTFAKDKVIELPVSKIIEKLDKNDNEYKIIIVKVPKVLNGIKYNASLMVMCFSDVLDQVSELQEGETLKAIVSMGRYNGKDSATLLAVIE